MVLEFFFGQNVHNPSVILPCGQDSETAVSLLWSSQVQDGPRRSASEQIEISRYNALQHRLSTVNIPLVPQHETLYLALIMTSYEMLVVN